LPHGREVEVLACFAVKDWFDLPSTDPDPDRAGFHFGDAGCFPEVAEVAVALELSEMDVEPVGIRVGDHDTSRRYEKAPTGILTAGA
jgi:hypothetical protein